MRRSSRRLLPADSTRKASQCRSKILFRDRAKGWRGELQLFVLWGFKSLSWLPILGNSYRSLVIHLLKRTELFDRTFYLERYGSIEHAGMSPLRHYVTFGEQEKRSPMPFFDPDYYHSRVPNRVKFVNTLLHYALVGRYRRISPSPWFDIDFYLIVNEDVARADVDPLLHFSKWGGTEGRSPSPEFDSAYYLQTNPSVVQSNVNPLLHYLRMGRFEGRSTLPVERISQSEIGPEDILHARIPDDYSWSGLRPRVGAEHTAIDVIVPVYKGRAETLRCLYSVLSVTLVNSFELIVIDDASPDAELVIDLQQLADKGLFTLLVNPKNRGFVHTINRGISLHPERDVVLLNADTEVYDGWLDRLRQAAYRHHRTGTVTPLSNNATICSYPQFLRDNPFPLELDFAELDSLAAIVNTGIEVEAPTGVGFCMYIKRATLEDVGSFDERNFGMGYGEENDFCQRAIRKGWHNIIAADIFVHHWGSTSFQGESSSRLQAGLKALERLHPRYQNDVNVFIDDDPLFDARQNLDRKRLTRLHKEKNVLMVCHARGGGAERHVQEDIRRLTAEGYGVFLMRPMPGQPSHAFFRHFATTQLPNLPAYALADTPAMCGMFKELGITEIHTHSLVDFVPEAPDLLLVVVKALDLRWEINLHDYEVICPSINLADSNGIYCGEPLEAICNKCLEEVRADFQVTGIGEWRGMYRRVLLAADHVSVPDQDVAMRLKRYFPEVTFDVSPHENLTHPPVRIPVLNQDEKLRVVVIGAIGKIKGFEVLLACARNARQRHLPLEFIIMGYSMNDRQLQEAGVRITGRYLEENAQDTLKKLSPHMVWLPSLWPETYSYTLSIALQAGLPVVAFDIGAIARRLRECGLSDNLLHLSMAHRPENINDRFLEKARYSRRSK